MDRHAPLKFFATAIAMATPLWALNLVLPDVDFLPKDIPLTDLGLAFVPMTAAIVLTWRRDGRAAVGRMMRRVFDMSRITDKRWLWVAVLLMPAIFGISYAVMLAAGRDIMRDDPMPLVLIFVVLPLLFALAAGEELGYFGYLWDEWERRFGAFGGAVLFALPWTALHIPSILQQGRGWGYIATQFAFSGAIRVLWTWLYHGSGRSIFAVIVVHAMANLMGTYFWQEYTSVPALIFAVIVTVLWGTKSLSSWRWWRARAPGDQVSSPT